MDSFLFKLIFAAALFGISFTIWVVHVQLRRLKYKRIARDLGAEYYTQGFASGKINGVSSGREFSITNRVFQVYLDSTPGNYYQTIWTSITVNCKNDGIALMIHRGFLKDFPNWKYVFTRNNKEADALGANIYSRDFAVLLDQKYRIMVQNFFHEVILSDYSFIKEGMIDIGKDRISFIVSGVFVKTEIIRQIILLLGRIAGRIESSPIV